jgi:hypothetical protein
MLSALSASFTYPSQVAAAITKDDERHSMNRFAVYVHESPEEAQRKEAERIAAKEREKERGSLSRNEDTVYDVPVDAMPHDAT